MELQANRVENLREYYADRLIWQYRSNQTNRNHIRAVVNQLFADGLPWNISKSFDIETAVGSQLDVVGKYIGVSRNIGDPISRAYFGFRSYTGGNPQNYNGMRSYVNDFNSGVTWYRYSMLGAENSALNDEEYRFVLKLKIAMNNMGSSLKDIDDYLYTFFADALFCVNTVMWGGPTMTLVYYKTTSHIPISDYVLKQFLPRPMGVNVILSNELNPTTRVTSTGAERVTSSGAFRALSLTS